MEIDSLEPDPLILGCGDLTINYTIYPTSGFTADSVKLEIRDKNNTLAYEVDNIDKTGGSHTATWNGKKNQDPHSDLYVNANNSPYVVKITIEKGESQDEDSENVAVQAKAISGVAISGYGGDAAAIGNKINALGYSHVHTENGFTTQEANSHTPQRLVWYCLAHGAGGKVELSDGKILKLQDLPSGLHYTLVFMNACESATGVATDFANKFGAKAYVGWEQMTPVTILSGFASSFFSHLDNFHTVQQAINAAKVDVPAAGQYGPKPIRGGSVKVDLP